MEAEIEAEAEAEAAVEEEEEDTAEDEKEERTKIVVDVDSAAEEDEDDEDGAPQKRRPIRAKVAPQRPSSSKLIDVEVGDETGEEVSGHEEDAEDPLAESWAGLEATLDTELPSTTPAEKLNIVRLVIILLSHSRTVRHSSPCCQVKTGYLDGKTVDQICRVLGQSVSQGANERVCVVVRRVLGNSLFICGVTHS